ncbi:CDGSH iron-sulfur domain-containing protein 3, mitochondrial-like isoform X1 [Mugil cephalus]|uniref:CDGSH iron-sulfur domain-containing protein 3, mitochondrial-like isoform X1 n=1 Tax=Mugil cephalus TaxID=48193 RepID=UPI001FB71100|nr:CDGSH iron-sulfur domain-containing protein 3, mitochondrial-like isoform X1 [Mugil cephalus]
MNTLVSKFDHKWISLTLRQPWMPSISASKLLQNQECSQRHHKKVWHCLQVRLSTLPPEPVIPSKKPFKVDVVGGKRYSWCSCGHSKKQPFCDGSHKTRAPGLSPLRFVPEKDSTVFLCGCKYTNSPPYCDGTHKQEFIASAPLHEQTEA